MQQAYMLFINLCFMIKYGEGGMIDPEKQAYKIRDKHNLGSDHGIKNLKIQEDI